MCKKNTPSAKGRRGVFTSIAEEPGGPSAEEQLVLADFFFLGAGLVCHRTIVATLVAALVLRSHFLGLRGIQTTFS